MSSKRSILSTVDDGTDGEMITMQMMATPVRKIPLLTLLLARLVMMMVVMMMMMMLKLYWLRFQQPPASSPS